MPQSLAAISGNSILLGADFGPRSLLAVSDFRFGGAETGSIADRDWFARCPSGIERTPRGVHDIGRLFGRHAMRILSRKVIFLVVSLLQAIALPHSTVAGA